jgi:cysteine desulfuration protein SufE
MSKSIQEIQDQLIEDFAVLDGDAEMTNFYIIELGQKLPSMEESKKTDENIVKGCQSKVWLTATYHDGRVYYEADSNTAITKGLVSLLVKVLNGQTPQAILEADLYFPQRIGMDRFIGTQRSNGFSAMTKQMRLFALALKAQAQTS